MGITEMKYCEPCGAGRNWPKAPVVGPLECDVCHAMCAVLHVTPSEKLLEISPPRRPVKKVSYLQYMQRQAFYKTGQIGAAQNLISQLRGDLIITAEEWDFMWRVLNRAHHEVKRRYEVARVKQAPNIKEYKDDFGNLIRDES
jgi:hypothetical protein